MTTAKEILDAILPGLTPSQTILFLGIVLATIILRGLFVRWAIKGVKMAAVRLGAEWDTEMAAVLRPPANALVVVYAAVLALGVLPLPRKPINLPNLMESYDHVILAVLALWLVFRLITVLESILRRKAAGLRSWMDPAMAPFLTIFLKVIVFCSGVIVIAHNMGYSVGALVASLGIGAAALALAARDTLANLFGSIMIMMDKPFQVGDWIKGEKFEGTVEEIGLRSTRIRTFDMTIVNVPNNLIANMLVENLDRRLDKGLNPRRVIVKLAVGKATPATLMEEALARIKQALLAEPLVSKGQEPLVCLTELAEASNEITIVYFTAPGDMEWLQTRQKVNLALLRLIEELGLQPAYPARMAYEERFGLDKPRLGQPNAASQPIPPSGPAL